MLSSTLLESTEQKQSFETIIKLIGGSVMEFRPEGKFFDKNGKKSLKKVLQQV